MTRYDKTQYIQYLKNCEQALQNHQDEQLLRLLFDDWVEKENIEQKKVFVEYYNFDSDSFTGMFQKGDPKEAYIEARTGLPIDMNDLWEYFLDRFFDEIDFSNYYEEFEKSVSPLHRELLIRALQTEASTYFQRQYSHFEVKQIKQYEEEIMENGNEFIEKF